jgi:putative phage-type endonuclease
MNYYDMIETDYVLKNENDENDENYENNVNDIIEVLLTFINDIIIENPCLLSCYDIDELIIDELHELVDLILDDIKTNNFVLYIDYSKCIDELELIEYSFNLYNTMFKIKLEHTNNDFKPNLDFNINIELTDFLEKQIDYLRTKPQHEQRTAEWYIFRHKLISASAVHKALGSQSAINSLICEKCQPLKQIDSDNLEVVKQVNINSPLHHGQKYEPLSVMLYEKKYNTKIEDFGCIRHDKYDFIGASPDGINVDKTSPLFGRMLEIKNVVSRVINGIPKKEYWIQMQQQMEVCNLDKCDFLETKFVEYESELDYKNDKDNTKGIMLYFVTTFGTPYYLYQPLNMLESESDTWIEENIEKTLDKMTWIKTIYWKLETYSCILVERNRAWFKHNVGLIETVWKTIIKERVDGHEHRLPTKRIKKTNNMDMEMEMEMETVHQHLHLHHLWKKTRLEW